MFDWKYHITSLVAVFLALGLGILIGAAMLPDDALVDEQQRLISGLEENFRLLRQENVEAQRQIAVLSKEISGYRDYLDEVLPLLLEGRLEGRTVGLVNTSDYQVPPSLLEALEMAGATIYAVTGLGLPEPGGDAEWLQTVNEILADDLASPAAAMDLMGRALGQALQKGQMDEFLLPAQGNGLVQTRGGLPGPVEAVVLLEGASNSNAVGEQLFLSLSDYILRNDILVVGATASNAAYSYAAHRSRRAVTIPKVDTPLGQLQLVLILAGRGKD